MVIKNFNDIPCKMTGYCLREWYGARAAQIEGGA